MTPRGVRLNNPGNIRLSGAHWLGKVYPPRDAEFEAFDTPEHGIRALAKVLLAYQRNHGLSTTDQIISRWAPPSENDTNAYVESVCGQTCRGPDEPLDLSDRDTLASLAEAIIRHENGTCPYGMAQIDAGVGLALA